MKIFDAHCDTLSRLIDEGVSLTENNGMVDLNRLSKYEGYVQVFAAFSDKAHCRGSLYLRTLSMIERMYSEAANNADTLNVCTSYAEIERGFKEGKTAAVLAVEGGEAIEGSLENLRQFYRRGVRMMTLTWNYENELGGSAADSADKGLTAFGGAVIEEMNRLGMLIDVSHLSERSFWDVIERSVDPICASHSNAQSICAHERNLTDAQICAIISRGGCIGINFYPKFVTGRDCGIDEIIEHIEYILELGGKNAVGLGSDFDGIDCTPRGLKGAEDMYSLINAMLRRGWNEELAEQISAGNFLRLICEVVG